MDGKWKCFLCDTVFEDDKDDPQCPNCGSIMTQPVLPKGRRVPFTENTLWDIMANQEIRRRRDKD